MSHKFSLFNDFLTTESSDDYPHLFNEEEITEEITFDPELLSTLASRFLDTIQDSEQERDKECADDCQDSTDSTNCNCEEDSDRFFEGLSFEVKHKNKTIPVKNAELEPYCCDAEDEGSPFTFSATLGENSNIRLFTRPVDEYDEDLSHVGNAKRFVSGYLKDNPEVATILEKIDDKDVHSYSAEATKAEEAVDIITAVKKHSWVSAVVSFPVEETFEVVSQLTSKNPEIRFEIYPAGKKNILVAV